ncbi:hypothetical protein GCM10008944_03890 [Cytobacillus oceanisediminis]
MSTHENQTATLSLDALPSAVRTFVTAHQAHDRETELSCFAEDATVTDEGRTHTGLAQLRAWLGKAESEYTYTTEVTGAASAGTDRYDVVHHLEGDFPGGVVDLHFRFVLDAAGRIASLVIEP